MTSNADHFSFGNIDEWNDFPSSELLPSPGAATPVFVVIPGTVFIGAWGFTGAGAAINALDGTFELLHDYYENTDLFPHVHFCASSANVGTIQWRFDYVILSIGSEMSAVATSIQVVNSAGLGANGRPIGQAVEFDKIPGNGLKIGAQIRFRVSRDPAADTYPDDALLFANGMHYRSNTIGSRQRFSKY